MEKKRHYRKGLAGGFNLDLNSFVQGGREMERDHVTILVVTPDKRGVRSLNIKTFHIRALFFVLTGFILVSLVSFVASYKLYKKAKHKNEVMGYLVNQIGTLSQALSSNLFLEDQLNERLGDIEEKLIEVQKLLRKKGIKKELSIGGEFIPADRLSSSYFDAVENDIDKLIDIIKTVPIGKPLSGKINSGFGYRKDPINSRLAFHSGIDIDAYWGQPVIATADGVVSHAGWYKGYGKTVIVEHKNGYETLYGHLSGLNVKEGQYVKSGDVIGFAGSTGRSTGPHLHYEILKNNQNVDPARYLSLR